MNHNARKTVRRAAAAEALQAAEMETRIQARLEKWIRITAGLGIALVVTIVAVVPFLKGFALHSEWEGVGKKILSLAMCLLTVFMYSAGTTYNFWVYLRSTKRRHRAFAPPGSDYRLKG